MYPPRSRRVKTPGSEDQIFNDEINIDRAYGQDSNGIPLVLLINIISGVVVLSAGTLLVILWVIYRSSSNNLVFYIFVKINYMKKKI